MPAPWVQLLVGILESLEEDIGGERTAAGPAPMRMARPLGGIGIYREVDGVIALMVDC